MFNLLSICLSLRDVYRFPPSFFFEMNRQQIETDVRKALSSFIDTMKAIDLQ
jgi:hypothetical protein